MRMWLVNPKILCDKHLLGEHNECHMFAGTLAKNKSIQGYVDNNLFEPESLQSRHDILADEITNRGFKHNSNLSVHTTLSHKIAKYRALRELLIRCNKCKQKAKEFLSDRCNSTGKL